MVMILYLILTGKSIKDMEHLMEVVACGLCEPSLPQGVLVALSSNEFDQLLQLERARQNCMEGGVEETL